LWLEKKLISKVVKKCDKLGIDVPDIGDAYVQWEKPMRQNSSVSNLHHYKHDYLSSIVYLQLQELNARFDE
jgi:hypothetical protein